MRISDWSSDVCSSDLTGELGRIAVAGDHDHRPVGTIPAIVKGADRGCARLAERLRRADRRADAEQLSGETMRVDRVGAPFLRTVGFAQLGHHDAAFGG